MGNADYNEAATKVDVIRAVTSTQAAMLQLAAAIIALRKEDDAEASHRIDEFFEVSSKTFDMLRKLAGNSE